MKKMVSMERTAPEMAEAANPSHNIPKYDYGLGICLSQDSLTKLNLDTDDVEVGDMLHFVCMASVTSISKNDTGDGPQCRIELQITHISLPENELTEFEAE